MTEPTGPNDATWFGARILAYRMGGLAAEAARRFEELQASDDTCVELWKAATSQDDPEIGHVPAAILAGWPRTRDRLGGLERDLVSRHLMTCASCRDDLARAGIRYDAGQQPPLYARHSRGLAVAALVAAATVLLFFLVRPTPEAPVLDYQLVRGGGANTFVVPLGATDALLRLPPADELGLGAHDPLVVDVLAPDGARVGHDAGPASAVTMPHAIRLRGDGPLPHGEYRVVIAGRPDTLLFRISGSQP